VVAAVKAPAATPDAAPAPPPPPPISVDLAAFDATAFLPVATAHARAVIADAELMYFWVNRVADDGRADLSGAGLDRWATFGFRSADPARRPCNVYVVVTGPSSRVEVDSDRCQARTAAPPRCTMAQAAARARPLSRRPDGERLKLQYGGGGDRWIVVAGQGKQLPFECP
jgi:hypothetical protein